MRGQPRNWFGSVDASTEAKVLGRHRLYILLVRPSENQVGSAGCTSIGSSSSSRDFERDSVLGRTHNEILGFWIIRGSIEFTQFGSVRLDSIDKSPAAPHCYCQGRYHDEPPSASDEEEENKWIFYKASASKDATIDNEEDDSSCLCTCRCLDCRRIQCHAQPSDGFQSANIDPSSPAFATAGS